MKERWLPVGAFAGALFGVNLIARLVVRVAAGKDDGKQIWIGLVALIATALVALAATVWWVRLRPAVRAYTDLAVGILVGCLFSTVVGPLISKGDAFAGGFGTLVLQLFYYLAICAAAVFFGSMGVIGAGQDEKSRSWKQFAEVVETKSRKKVRQ